MHLRISSIGILFIEILCSYLSLFVCFEITFNKLIEGNIFI